MTEDMTMTDFLTDTGELLTMEADAESIRTMKTEL